MPEGQFLGGTTGPPAMITSKDDTTKPFLTSKHRFDSDDNVVK